MKYCTTCPSAQCATIMFNISYTKLKPLVLYWWIVTGNAYILIVMEIKQVQLSLAHEYCCLSKWDHKIQTGARWEKPYKSDWLKTMKVTWIRSVKCMQTALSWLMRCDVDLTWIQPTLLPLNKNCQNKQVWQWYTTQGLHAKPDSRQWGIIGHGCWNKNVLVWWQPIHITAKSLSRYWYDCIVKTV